MKNSILAMMTGSIGPSAKSGEDMSEFVTAFKDFAKNSTRPTKVDLGNLPGTLRDLAKALNGRPEVARPQTPEESRRAESAALSQKFNANLQELNSVLGALSKAQEDAARQMEAQVKESERSRKLAEAARQRESRLQAVSRRQAAANTKSGASILGAIFGGGVRDFITRSAEAKEATRKDTEELSEARYADKVAKAEETRDSSIAAIDAGKVNAVRAATATYAQDMQGATADFGKAQLQMQAVQKELDAVDKIRAAHATAKAELAAVDAEIAAFRETSETPPVSGGAIAVSGPASPSAPLIVSPDGTDALAARDAEKARDALVQRQTSASEKVSATGDAVVSASDKENATLVAYAAAKGAAEAASSKIEGLRTEYESKVASVTTSADRQKEEARLVAEGQITKAADERDSGALVDAATRKGIARSNYMNSVVAPPAVVLISKVMEKFRDMFPVIEQAGNAIIEGSTALPAVILTASTQLMAKSMSALGALRDAISERKVSKAYDKSDAEYKAEHGHTRAELYSIQEQRNLDAFTVRATDPMIMHSGSGMAIAGGVRAVANAPKAFTYQETQGTSSGITHAAPERPAVTHEPYPAQRQVERPVGVVPVSASNRNVDEWR